MSKEMTAIEVRAVEWLKSSIGLENYTRAVNTEANCSLPARFRLQTIDLSVLWKGRHEDRYNEWFQVKECHSKWSEL